MAELTAIDATTANSCCAQETQATCCAPSAKADCCDPSHGGGCECSSGKTAASRAAGEPRSVAPGAGAGPRRQAAASQAGQRGRS